ncbi:siderophore-interacting protein [Microlunatus sp. Gsoil 973]|uniref:siderophore-interacting protein n=1 Tax=Microlunatus sp. Gsoil 973 TaxID=2672569 RepID=UPI0012B4BCF2|nr:siderophore-interacting protein [Microlunatus sp. Gsoil 973]QGN34715.1 siderophore-interacting protein [Microlunatus sp. Gsoil 973]
MPDQPEPGAPERLRRRGGPPKTATLLRKEWLNDSMVRLFFGGADVDQLSELEYTDHYLKILFPGPVTRTYTIRSLDRKTGELAIDFVVHGDEGLAGPWAATVDPGAVIEFRGPGGGYAPQEQYDAHLLAGDEAAIPAIAAAIERLPVQASAVAVLEVADADHRLAVPSDRAEIVWVHRDGRPYGERLAEVVRERGLPEGRVQVFVHGNAGMVKDLRRYFFLECGLDRRDASISGYWRTGQNEDAWQAGKHEFVAQMEAEEAAVGSGAH